MSSAFIGRDRELAELSAGLQGAIDGRRSVFLITGEAGIGKTALAEQLAGRAVERGARVLWGRGWEGGAPPYWPWAQILGALGSEADEDTLRPFLTSGSGHLATLVPQLAERVGAAPPPVRSLDPETSRFSLFEATARFLKATASVRPLLLLLDDIMAGDRPSLLLLRFLTREVRMSRLLVVATCRTGDAAQFPEAADVVADLVREGQVLVLRGMSREEVARLIAGISGKVPWKTKAAALHGATDGNPLFVREVARLIAADDRLDRPGRLTIPIPPSVRAVIRRRLAPLSAGAVTALSAAAVVGHDVDLHLMGPACHLPMERVLAALSEAIALGIVIEVRDAVGVYRFSHPLMRDVIYEQLPIPARSQMHRQIGRLSSVCTAAIRLLTLVSSPGISSRRRRPARRPEPRSMLARPATRHGVLRVRTGRDGVSTGAGCTGPRGIRRARTRIEKGAIDARAGCVHAVGEAGRACAHNCGSAVSNVFICEERLRDTAICSSMPLRIISSVATGTICQERPYASWRSATTTARADAVVSGELQTRQTSVIVSLSADSLAQS